MHQRMHYLDSASKSYKRVKGFFDTCSEIVSKIVSSIGIDIDQGTIPREKMAISTNWQF